MSESLTSFLCDPDLLLERITHSANQTEKLIRASNDPTDALSRIIAANDVVFALWNDSGAEDSTGYSIVKGRDVLEKIKAGAEREQLTFNSHPLNGLRNSLSAVATFGTPERAAILTDAGAASETAITDTFSRM